MQHLVWNTFGYGRPSLHDYGNREVTQHVVMSYGRICIAGHIQIEDLQVVLLKSSSRSHARTAGRTLRSIPLVVLEDAASGVDFKVGDMELRVDGVEKGDEINERGTLL